MALDARLEELSEKHRALDRKIEEELSRPTADDLKIALFTRFGHRYCNAERPQGDILVLASVGRVAVEKPAPLPAPSPFLRFSCAGSRARIAFARLSRDRVATFSNSRINASVLISGTH